MKPSTTATTSIFGRPQLERSLAKHNPAMDFLDKLNSLNNPNKPLEVHLDLLNLNKLRVDLLVLEVLVRVPIYPH